jgi:hypothetical protein
LAREVGGYTVCSMEESPICRETCSSADTSAVGSITAGIASEATSTSSELELVTPPGSEGEPEGSHMRKITLSESTTSDVSISLSTPSDLEQTMIEELTTHRLNETHGSALGLMVGEVYKGVLAAPTASPTPDDESESHSEA